MAAYYPISASPKESPTSTYPRGPGRVLCNESSFSGNIMYTNYSSSDNLAGSSQSPQNAVEHSVPGNILLPGSSITEMITSSHLGDHQYNAWRDGRNELPFMQTACGPINSTTDLVDNNIADHQMGMGMQFNVLNSRNVSLQQSSNSAVQGQGLSLSLGTEIPISTFQFHAAGSNVSVLGSHQTTSGSIELNRKDNSRDKQFNAYPAPYALSNCTSTLPNSKYLKAAQELLDEVVNVRKALKGELGKSQSLPNSSGNANGKESDNVPNSGVPTKPNESASNSTIELSPDERQDLQNKMAKLLAMLDEIDRSYRQYYNQMQIVISSFDVVAGCGAAKPYTALALQTISRHFRCLRDAINGQIQNIRKNLGEDGLNKGGAISRLRYIDQHLKQQRAFQQFGIMQQNAWRPQRGLPENSVSILRAWLFEHFLHPYPKDSDKIMLARQTGLTRSQVSNWFINARVRLWKPMVEEMYKEEIGNGEIDTKSSSENAPTNRDELGLSEDKEGNQSMKSGAEKSQSSQLNESSRSNVLPETNIQNGVNAADTNHINLKARGPHANMENHSLLQDALVQASDGGRLMSYQMAELGRYGNAGISLTLGLHHCEGGIPVSDEQHSFASLRGDDMFIAAPLGASDATEYNNNYMNLADSRHRIGSSQLLHDFVA